MGDDGVIRCDSPPSVGDQSIAPPHFPNPEGPPPAPCAKGADSAQGEHFLLKTRSLPKKKAWPASGFAVNA